jgi:heptosyltransferase I
VAPSILIIKTSALGDIAQALPVADYLKERFPRARIDWMVEKPWAELVALHPAVDELQVVDTKRWRKEIWKCRGEMRDFVRKLRSHPYDMLFDLQGNVKSGLLTAMSNAKEKIGFGRRTVAEWPNLLATERRYDPPAGLSMTRHYLALVQNHFHDTSYFSLKELPASQPLRSKKRLVVAFGSRWENKRLKQEELAALLKEIAGKIDLEIVLIWKEEEERLFAEGLEREISVKALGNLTLAQLYETIAQAAGLLTVDSAALHLAALAKTPAFALFGPSESALYLPEGPGYDALQGHCPYDLLFEKRCPKLRTCATGACLKQLPHSVIFPYFRSWWEGKACEKRGRRVTRCTELVP